MKLCKIILTMVIGCSLVEGSQEGKKFDLVKFLEKIWAIKPTLPPVASLESNPALGSLGSAPPAGSLSSQAECRDIANWCPKYKSYCTYPTVKKYCKITCNLCATPVEEANCRDVHTSCSIGLKYEYCTGNTQQRGFMMKFCRKSCQFCVPKKVTCNDKQEEGYCQRNKGFCHLTGFDKFFKENCAKTCGYCGGEKRSFTCGVAKQRSKTGTDGIVGGTNAGKGYFPWQVAVYYNNVFMCGGTLIDTKHILTAAHCFNGRSKDVTQYKVVLGEHNRKYDEGTEQSRDITKIVIHEHYRDMSDDHDIALMKIKTPAKLNNHVTPACLPNGGENVQVGTKCYITGWGKTQHDGQSVDILQKVKVPVVSKSFCGPRNTFNFHQVTDKMICTGFDDGSTFVSGCHGDSGGPLSCENNGVWTVQGVVSWGSPLCNGLDRYTVFSRVNSYKTWIRNNSA